VNNDVAGSMRRSLFLCALTVLVLLLFVQADLRRFFTTACGMGLLIGLSLIHHAKCVVISSLVIIVDHIEEGRESYEGVVYILQLPGRAKTSQKMLGSEVLLYGTIREPTMLPMVFFKLPSQASTAQVPSTRKNQSNAASMKEKNK
jgi:hypothetical protein